MDNQKKNLLILTSNYQNTRKSHELLNVCLFTSNKNQTPSNMPLSLHNATNKLPQILPDRLPETGYVLPAGTHTHKLASWLQWQMKFYYRSEDQAIFLSESTSPRTFCSGTRLQMKLLLRVGSFKPRQPAVSGVKAHTINTVLGWGHSEPLCRHFFLSFFF